MRRAVCDNAMINHASFKTCVGQHYACTEPGQAVPLQFLADTRLHIPDELVMTGAAPDASKLLPGRFGRGVEPAPHLQQRI